MENCIFLYIRLASNSNWDVIWGLHYAGLLLKSFRHLESNCGPLLSILHCVSIWPANQCFFLPVKDALVLSWSLNPCQS